LIRLIQQFAQFWGLHNATIGKKFKPKDRFVSFFNYNTKLEINSAFDRALPTAL
jgi:hypothetical protein